MLVEIWEDDLIFFEDLLIYHESDLREQIDNTKIALLKKAIKEEIQRTVDAQLRLSVSLEGGNNSSRVSSDFESLVRNINNDNKEYALSITKSIAKVCGVNL